MYNEKNKRNFEKTKSVIVMASEAWNTSSYLFSIKNIRKYLRTNSNRKTTTT